MAGRARLFFTDSESNADLYYLSRFLAGDPFLFLETGGTRTLFLNDLEVDRGRRQAAVEEVVRLKKVTDKVKEEDGALPPRGYGLIGRCIKQIAVDRGLDQFDVGESFPLALGDILRSYGFDVRWAPGPFVAARACKTEDEIGHIKAAVGHTERAMTAAIDQIRRAEIRGDELFWDSKQLTSEMVKQTVNRVLLDLNCHGYECIVAGGEQGVDPHERGSGPLPANSPIILDIFPRDNATRYHGDMTRTVVRGKASDEVKRMHDAVAASKAAAEAEIRDGADGKDVHAAAKKVFADAGYETGVKDGRMVGFFHGTGHGLGLQVHEFPHLGDSPCELKAGHVVTVEPGLYYPGVGGLRIEDDVVVREDGCENLCQLEVVLEV
ncbi:MAG: M24 family metallopeptidase [Planctomycetota bacterium]|jgi:Xaa-Pro aminopeptidase